MSFTLTRYSSHKKPRLASTSCVKGSKDCLSGAVCLEAARPESPQNAGAYFGSAGKRHSCFGSEANKNRLASDLHPLIEGSARCVPLADTPALNACVLRGRHAASPTSGEGAGGPLGCPEPFVLVGAKLVALRNRLRRWMFGVGSRG